MPKGSNYRKNPYQLTDRQIELLRLVAEGMTNEEIGKKLFLVETTVKDHLRLAYKKLGTTSRVLAVVLGIKEGWIPLGDPASRVEEAAARLYGHIYHGEVDEETLYDFNLEPDGLKDQMRQTARIALNITEEG